MQASYASLSKLLIAVAIVTVALVAWLALMPAERSYGGHDHNHGVISAISGVQQADGGPSCTHNVNSHRHTGKTHKTSFTRSYRSGGYHHHQGTLYVTYDNGGIYSTGYDRKCPMH